MKRTPYDIVGQMMAWEDGELGQRDTLELFQHLVDNGMAWTLQGMYGRTATALLEGGLIHARKEPS